MLSCGEEGRRQLGCGRAIFGGPQVDDAPLGGGGFFSFHPKLCLLRLDGSRKGSFPQGGMRGWNLISTSDCACLTFWLSFLFLFFYRVRAVRLPVGLVSWPALATQSAVAPVHHVRQGDSARAAFDGTGQLQQASLGAQRLVRL